MTTAQALEHAEAMDAFTPVGLRLPDKLSGEDYYALAMQLKVMGDSTGYARADLAYRIKIDFPEDYRDRWVELANIWGKVLPTIANDALVGEKYTHDERLGWMTEGLSYSHIRIAAGVEPQERREALLASCCTEGWSVARLSHEIWGASTPPKQLAMSSRDGLQKKYSEWLDTLDTEDGYHWEGLTISERTMAASYVGKFLDWIEEQSK